MNEAATYLLAPVNAEMPQVDTAKIQARIGWRQQGWTPVGENQEAQ